MRRSAATAIALLALAGCGEDEQPAPSPSSPAERPPQRPAATVAVSETEYRIEPANPTVPPGTVAFRVRNEGGLPHALEVEGPEGEVETRALDPGAATTLEVRLTRSGTYTWYCPIGDHEDRGMKGTITVRAKGPKAGGGAAASGGPSREAGGDRRTGEGRDHPGY